MITQHTVNRFGAEYTYFFCRNKQNKTCATPHINVAIAETAVERHYATIRLSDEHLDALRDHITIVDNGPGDEHGLCARDLYRQSSARAVTATVDSSTRLFRKLYIADGRITDHELTTASPRQKIGQSSRQAGTP